MRMPQSTATACTDCIFTPTSPRCRAKCPSTRCRQPGVPRGLSSGREGWGEGVRVEGLARFQGCGCPLPPEYRGECSPDTCVAAYQSPRTLLSCQAQAAFSLRENSSSPNCQSVGSTVPDGLKI